MIVRRLVADDHVALREVRLSALRGAPHAYGSTYEREIAFTDEVWRDRLLPGGNPHFGAFDNDGSLVGLAVGALDGDDPVGAFVVGVWIEPPARGGDLLARLIDEVALWASADGRTVLRLHVTDGNERAERSYRTLGFVRTGDFEVRPRDLAREFEMVRPNAAR
ncbi:MAG: GNAT family N-acetyltransferase [Actinomycetota bacterium]